MRWSPADCFSLTTAIGGIKLQVPQSQLEEALRLLDAKMDPESAPIDWSTVDVGESEEIDAKPKPESDSRGEAVDPMADNTLDEEQSLREHRAERLFRGWLVGLLFFPLMFLAFWRVIQVFVSDEPLRPQYRRKAQVASVFIIISVMVVLFFCVTFRRV